MKQKPSSVGDCSGSYRCVRRTQRDVDCHCRGTAAGRDARIRRKQRHYLSASGGRRLECRSEVTGYATGSPWRCTTSRTPSSALRRSSFDKFGFALHEWTGLANHGLSNSIARPATFIIDRQRRDQIYVHRIEPVRSGRPGGRFSNTWIRWRSDVRKGGLLVADRETAQTGYQLSA